MVKQDELDLKSPGRSEIQAPGMAHASRIGICARCQLSPRHARRLLHTTDEHLLTPWKFVVGGQVVSENPRHVMIVGLRVQPSRASSRTTHRVSAAQRGVRYRHLWARRLTKGASIRAH